MPDQYQKCARVTANGARCGSPAIHDSIFCYWHLRSESRNEFHVLTGPPLSQRPNNGVVIPNLEDANAIQIGIEEITHAIVEHRIDTKRAWLLLYALQLASKNLPHLKVVDKDEAVAAIEDPQNVANDVAKLEAEG